MKTSLPGIYTLILLAACIIPESTAQVNPTKEEYSGEWEFKAGKEDTDVWQPLSSTLTLEEQGFTTTDGFGQLRKTITFSESMQCAIEENGGIVVRTGKLAAADEMRLNGKLIGKTGDFPPDYKGYFDHQREYFAGKEVLNLTGENIITILFHDGWGKGGFLDNTLLSVSAATTEDKLVLEVDVADEDYIFMLPAPLTIQVGIENKNEQPIEGELLVTLSTDDHQPLTTESKKITIPAQESFSQVYTYTNPQPGFYRYHIRFIRNGEVVKEKKLNVGYEPEKILSPNDANPDFKEFWENSLQELSEVAPEYKLTLQPHYSQLDYEVYLVEMYSLGNELIKGYYAKPKKEGKHPVIVEYMGYGSSPYPPNQWWDGFAYFVLSIRGQALNEPENRFGTWVTAGLENKENYYYRGAFMDVVRALDFISSRPEIDADKIAVRGGSQGGALSLAAAALDKRVKVAAPNIPFLTDFRDYFRITHWPRVDFERYLQEHPEADWEQIYDVLSYFDIKNLAGWITCPVIMGIGVQDEVCPPHINFASYNQVAAEKRWMAFPEFGHSVGKEYHDAAMKFIKEHLQLK